MKIWKLTYDFDNNSNNDYRVFTEDGTYPRQFSESMRNDSKVKDEWNGIALEHISGEKKL